MVDMRGGFAFSVGAHALIIALLIFGLPYFHRKPPDMPPMISVELVEVGKETTTNKVSTVNKVKEKVEEEKPQPPTPPPPEAKAQPQPEPELEPVQPSEATPTLKMEKVDNTIAELKVPELVQKQEPTPPPTPKQPELKKEPPKPPAPSFDSILKQLAKQKVQEPTTQPPVPTAKATPARPTGAQAPISAKLTASENDRLMEQINRCWTAPSAVKDAQNLIVVLSVTVNPDRTVSAIQVEDQGRMGDPVFRAAAMAAQRALRMPECQVLDLPPDKYQDWQDLELTFDPTKMLG